MLRNSSEIFVHQCMKSKFMDTLEDVLTPQRTSPVIREHLPDVLAAAAHASSSTPSKNESSFRVLWRKVSPPGKPDEGVLFDYDHGMFNPPSPRQISPFSPTLTPSYQTPVHSQVLQVTPVYNSQPQAMPPQPQSQRPQRQAQTRALPQPTRARRNVPNQGQLQRIVPPEEDMHTLSEAPAFASLQNLREKEIRDASEWHTRCLASQELIPAQIPWATAGVDRSCATREAQPAALYNKAAQLTKLNMSSMLNESSIELTLEKLLGALLEANDALTGIEHQAMECNRQEVRLGHSPSTSPSPSPQPPQLSIPASLWPHKS
ncbi:hypothetical protein BJV78DRAFT_1176427 [Lactifluus subvellereus]|nr:hypothetical protein BJV78DRAFT_1176427 [Lactifluus subvellereus]